MAGTGTGSNPRYVVRPGEEPGQWQVYDTLVKAPVYGAESMTESAATDYTRRLNQAYREFRRPERPT
jgi:hypothetical protein